MLRIFTTIALFSFVFSFSQEIKLNKRGSKFEKDGVTYKISEYKTQFNNPIAKNLMKEGRGYRTASSILGFSGGFLIGAGLPNALSKTTYTGSYDYTTGVLKREKVKKPGWTLVGIGLGAIAIGIPFAIIGENKIKKGVETENQFGSTANNYLQLEINENGAGLSYNF